MNKYLVSNRPLRVFNEAISSSWSTTLNIALVVSLLISLFTPYKDFGIALGVIIGAAEILFIASLYATIQSTSSRYKVINAEIEWSIDISRPGIIRSKKRYTIKLLQTAQSICFYLEPTEKIIETPDLLAVFSEKRCEDKNYGYTPVELHFSSYHPKGTEVPIEIETEIRRTSSSNSGTIAFHTHNKTQQLSLYFSTSKNGRDHRLLTKLKYQKGQNENIVASNTVLFKRHDKGPKLIWGSDEIVDDAVYKIQWEFD